MTFEESTIDAEGNDVSLTEDELVFSTGIFAGGNISIKSGTIWGAVQEDLMDIVRELQEALI